MPCAKRDGLRNDLGLAQNDGRPTIGEMLFARDDAPNEAWFPLKLG